jgi:predicted RNA-binding protein with PIN domain
MQYIFDGHNLVFAVRGSGEQFAALSVEAATHFLCHVLEQYLIIKKSRGILFYDGMGPADKRFFQNFSRLDVEFAGDFYEADDYIEAEIEANSAPKRLVVVSSDRKIRDKAKRRRATSIPSMDFWLDVLKEVDKPRRKVKEPAAKQKGITSSEVSYWMRMFKLE